MPKLFNPALAGNWENWVRVFLLVAIGASAIHFTHRLISKQKEA